MGAGHWPTLNFPNIVFEPESNIVLETEAIIIFKPEATLVFNYHYTGLRSQEFQFEEKIYEIIGK